MNAAKKILFCCLTIFFGGINIISVTANDPLYAQGYEGSKNLSWEEVKLSEQIPDAAFYSMSTEEFNQRIPQGLRRGSSFGNPDMVKKFNSKQLHLIISELIKKYQIKSKIHPIVIENLESKIFAMSQLLWENETGKQDLLSEMEDSGKCVRMEMINTYYAACSRGLF